MAAAEASGTLRDATHDEERSTDDRHTTTATTDRAGRRFDCSREHIHVDPRRWGRRRGHRARTALPSLRQSGARRAAITLADGGTDRQGFAEHVAVAEPVGLTESFALPVPEFVRSGDRQPQCRPDR